MDRKPLIVSQGDYGEALDVIGTKVCVLADREQTGGQEFTFQSGPAGSGPPPHSHDWNEAFFVLEGSVEFIVGEDVTLAETGALVFVPGGTTHAFRYGPDGGKILEMTSQTSQAASLFAGLAREVPPGPPDIDAVKRVFAGTGVSLDIPGQGHKKGRRISPPTFSAVGKSNF